jgi:hypothetical protein
MPSVDCSCNDVQNIVDNETDDDISHIFFTV